MTVSVVVPVRDALKFLPSSTSSILRALERFGSGEVIFVDNGSTDGSLQFLQSLEGPSVHVLSCPEGKVGGLRNLGAARARGRYLSFIDADCVVGEGYFFDALRVLSETGAAVTGSLYALPDAPHWTERVWFPLHSLAEDGWTSYLNAGNLFCERSAFDSVGGFDATLESGEDTELCQRLRASGLRIYSSVRVRAVHLGNPKSLRAFYRKQVWHGLGGLGTFSQDPFDKVVWMTAAHWLFVAAAVALWALRPSVATAGAGLLLFFAAPAISVVYRMSGARRVVNPFLALILYWVYFAARGVALLRALRVLRDPGARV